MFKQVDNENESSSEVKDTNNQDPFDGNLVIDIGEFYLDLQEGEELIEN